MQVSIELVTSANTEDAFQLIEEYYDAICVTEKDDRETILHYILAPHSGIWVAYADGVAAGCILVRPLPSTESAGEIKRLYVRPSYRRQGIAKDLLEALEAFARSEGTKWLYLDSTYELSAAMRLYEKYGYQYCERYNYNPQATIHMRKQLQPEEKSCDRAGCGGSRRVQPGC